MNGLLTVPEVAQILKVHINTVYRYIYTGQIKATKLSDNSRWRIRSDDLKAFLEVKHDAK